jgi:predicted alpha/beta superfamily hydrolase
MRSVYLVIITLVTLFSFSNQLLAEEEAVKDNGKLIEYNFGNQYQIQSKILGEERQLLIYVPEQYKKSTDKFPVIYILDGKTHYKHAVVTIETLQNKGQIPASIIVAITDNKNTHRRDFVNKRDNFLRFIKEEVQTFVSNKFRVNGYKTIFGHSRPAAFVLETFIKDPDSFDNYIAANPIIRDELITKFKELLGNNKTGNQSLYFSMGGVHDVGPNALVLMNKLTEALKNTAPKSLQWKYQYFPQHVHHTTPNVSLYEGLAVNFTDYQDPIISSYQKFIDGNGMEGVQAYFRKRANKYYTSDEVTTNTIAGLGYAFMEGNNEKESVKLLIDVIHNLHPESIHLHRVLGNAYEKMKSYKQALEIYEKMVFMAKQQNKLGIDYYESQVERVKSKI